MANLPICSRAGRTSRTIDFKGGQYPNYGASMDVYPWETGRLRRVTEMVAEKSGWGKRSEEHTSELQSRLHLVCRLLLEKKELQLSVPSITQSVAGSTCCFV